eukprot:scaffold16666_cov159-Isochrysis_galbana.AAC.2
MKRRTHIYAILNKKTYPHICDTYKECVQKLRIPRPDVYLLCTMCLCMLPARLDLDRGTSLLSRTMLMQELADRLHHHFRVMPFCGQWPMSLGVLNISAAPEQRGHLCGPSPRGLIARSADNEAWQANGSSKCGEPRWLGDPARSRRGKQDHASQRRERADSGRVARGEHGDEISSLRETEQRVAAASAGYARLQV